MPKPEDLTGIDKMIKEANSNYPGGLPYAGLLSSVLGNLRTTTERAVAGFSAGNPIAGTGGVLEMVGSLMPLFGIAGPITGTVATIIGAMFSLTGGVLSAFAPQRETLSQQIAKELDKFYVKDLKIEMSAADEAFESALAAYLEMDNASRTWEDINDTINLSDSNAMHTLQKTKSWMRTNIDSAEWPDVFEKYWYTLAQRKLMISVSNSKLRTDTDALRVGLGHSKSLLLRDQQFAHEIHRAALNAGTLWHVGDNRKIYKRGGVVNGKSWDKTSYSADDLAVVGPKKTLFLFDRAARKVSANEHEILAVAEKANSGAASSMRNFCVALDAKNNTAHVFAVGTLGDFYWNAVPAAPKEKPQEEVACRLSDDEVFDIQAITTPDGKLLVFLLVGKDIKTAWGGSTSRSVRRYIAEAGDLGKLKSKLQSLKSNDLEGNNTAHPSLSLLKGIAVNRDYIYMYSDTDIYRARVGETTSKWRETWESVKKAPLKDGQTIKYLSVSEDGQLMVLLSDTKIQALFENVRPETDEADTDDKETVWVNETNAEALAVFKTPTRGYELFHGYLACCAPTKDHPPEHH